MEVDVNTRKCSKRLVGVYQTSLNSQNLIFDGYPKAEFQDKYDENKRKYPSIQDCPTEKPYFDGFGCISCPSGNPYFSLIASECSNCPAQSAYIES